MSYEDIVGQSEEKERVDLESQKRKKKMVEVLGGVTGARKKEQGRALSTEPGRRRDRLGAVRGEGQEGEQERVGVQEGGGAGEGVGCRRGYRRECLGPGEGGSKRRWSWLLRLQGALPRPTMDGP